MEESNEKINKEMDEFVEPNIESTKEADTESAEIVEIVNDDFEDDPPASKKSQLIIICLIFSVLIFAIAGWWFWTKNALAPEEAGSKADVVVSVRVAKVVKKRIAGEVSAVGSVSPVRQAIVSSNSGGQIKGLRRLQNEYVRQGVLLATIDTRDLQAQKREAEAVLKEARLNLQTLRKSTIPQSEIQTDKDLRDAKASVDISRNLFIRRTDLYQKGGIALKDVEAAQLAVTHAESNLKFLERSKNLRSNTANSLNLETARARVSQAEQRIKTLQTQMELSEIRAPISGYVIEQTQFDGEYAAAGRKILTIADLSEVIVKTQFADTVITRLRVGDEAMIYLDDLSDFKISGKVSLISRSTDPANRATEVWVNYVNDAGILRARSSARVVISENEQLSALTVPNSAVSLDTSNSKTGVVMVVDGENIAHERRVETGIRTIEETQIVSGLTSDDLVIIDGNYALPDGTKVEFKKEESTRRGERIR
ncbi:MAG: efflux RND transporter periplasmic adaptor subunit [Acidobacteria bacterium]|nr:efflux RND transporter periplasmic adaptor subunit [Acidobacteriota bacterium]